MTTPAADTKRGPSTLPDGLYLSGQFIGTTVQKGQARPDGSGTYPDRFVVTVLNGNRTTQIEYRDEQQAKDAFDGALPHKLDPVFVPVGVRAAKGYVFYFGRRVGQ